MFKAFISYSHQDEWLKDELITHLSALKRNGRINEWHDRTILPGQNIGDEVDSNAEDSDIFLLLVSSSFLQSDYCYEREYQTAVRRHKQGQAIIVPVIVRECDWDVGGLREFNALPQDGVAVTKDAGSKADIQTRDGRWHNVVSGLKVLIDTLEKKMTPPDFRNSYVENLFLTSSIKHPSVEKFDINSVYVDPILFSENTKSEIISIKNFIDIANDYRAIIISGTDRSGKTTLSKKLQVEQLGKANPYVLINGSDIRNVDIINNIKSHITEQFEGSLYRENGFSVIIDDFDECILNDSLKEKLIRTLIDSFNRLVLVSYSSAPSVLFAQDDLPNPLLVSIETLSNDRIYDIVKKWRSLSGVDVDENDQLVVDSLKKIQFMFSQTAMTRHPYSVITFLELIDNYTGTDIIGSSFAAYYDAIITQRLISSGASVNEVDELKDFLSHAAFQAFSDQSEPVVSLEKLNELYKYFETAYFSSSVSIKKVVHKSILIDKGGKFEFSEEYMWYYLTARYVAHILFKSDYNAYVGFVEDCALNIFKKRYANIAIFIAYFTDDSSVIDSLLSMLDMLFSKAESWRLSDDAREVMLGLSSSDGLMIDASPDYDEKRSALLQQNVTDILADAEHVVAQYTLPFLERGIDDSEFVDEVDSSFDNIDSYMKSVNALLRIHSVIGHILTSRSGTYKAQTLIRCISAMAQASGRYANLNHAIATVLLFDKERYVAEAEHLQMDGDLSAEEKYEKIMRIFAFWSVYMAQAGLARCLSQSHSVRALKHLSETEEAVSAWKGKKIPFNYTSVYILSDLYNTGKINKNEINSVLEKYGRHSSLVAMLRVAFHIYAYYMPMSVQNKQWIAKKLGMSLKTLSKQQFLSFRKNGPSGK